MPNCLRCNSSNFYESAGFFYCNVCDTECHHLQNTINENDYETTQNINHTSQHWSVPENLVGIPLGDSAGKALSLFTPGEPASSFVLADVILRAQVQWLCENVGVSRAFENTVKVIWFRYLTKALPDMKDGIVKALTDRWKKSPRKSDLTELCNCKSTDLKQAFAYWQITASDCKEENFEDEFVVTCSRSRSKARGLSKFSGSSEQRTSAEKISLSKIFAVLSFSLFVCNEAVLTSDLLRWARLLLLPCMDPSSLIPDDQLTTFYLLSCTRRASMVSYNEIEWGISVVMQFLEITRTELPKMSIMPVIERFVCELNLPNDFVPVAAALAESLSVLDFILDSTARKDHDCVRCPENIEAFVMSVIIYSMKIIFGLDDLTETILTTQTRKIQAKITDETILFDFHEWMHYVDCRRVVLFKHTNLMGKRSVTAALGMISRNLVDDKRKLSWSRVNKNKFHDENYEDIQRALQEVTESVASEKELYLQLPVTLRPFRAHGHAASLHMSWLDVDFSRDSLDHVLYRTNKKFVFDANGDCSDLLEGIMIAQKQAFENAVPIRTSNVKEELKLIPQLCFVSSSSLQWLLSICAEMIEQRPESLLGNLMFLENCLFSEFSSCQPKTIERMKRFGFNKK